MVRFSLNNDLNEEQIKIVQSKATANLIFAGAGTGKTRTVLYKIIHILMTEKPHLYNFFITTFTNKAADELRERISKYTDQKIFFPYLGTFHSLSARILRKYIDIIGFKKDFTIYDESDSVRVLKRELPKELLDEYKPEKILKIFSFYKENHFETNENLPKEFQVSFNKYEAALKRYNAFDFSDLLEKLILLFTERDDVLLDLTKYLKFLFVDEFQDTNLAQYKILKLLWSGISRQHKDPYLMVVGDENQSIYGFRNANVENILNFPKDFKDTKVFTLDMNYRSTNEILSVAKYLAFKNPYKTENLKSANEISGEKVKYAILQTDRDEARYIIEEIEKLYESGIKYGDIAVFFRTNFQIRLLETYFADAQLPHVVVGAQKFYERMEIKDVLSYVKYIVNENDLISFIRMVNVPKRGIGKATLEKIVKKVQKDLKIYEAIEELFKEKGISKKQHETLNVLLNLIDKYRAMEKSPADITLELLEDINYFEYLNDFDEEKADSRKDNVKYLLKEIKRLEFEDGLATLFDIIERLSLYSSVDAWEKGKAVNLMTLHLSKGLEFDAVFISGVEEGIIPHQNSKDKKEIADEQRLLYVGITRGKKYVYLTRASSRFKYGNIEANKESCFIERIPDKEFNIFEPGFIFRSRENDFHKRTLIKNISVERGSGSITGFKKGEKVRHKKFGVGLVIDSFIDGEYTKVNIRFYKYGKKTIIAKFLEKYI
ncbi:UvrD-helicase domain-containing protein [bacterium]|nr:UvrD-helicase domain-containing protein [bacterium]